MSNKLKKCKFCHSDIQKKEKVCPNCGRKVKRHGWVFPLFVVIVLCVAFSAAVNSKSSSGGSSASRTTLGKAMELSVEQEATMIDVFTQCGIGEITSAVKFQGGEGHTSYHLKDKETSAYKSGTIVVWVTDETKTVESIYFKDHDIYLDGAVVAQITDFYVNSTDRDNYRVAAQLAVNQLLNYPDTAKYPAISGWVFGIEDNIVIVQSSVKAKNAFNMEDNLSFQVKFESGNIISLILDGKEYISQ
ncbi:MAG: hypothetical protein K2M42_12080 [Oscillospiraceae bacterium]|nr:hypothetical protein [Oscillospiraceae bacterium]